MGVIAHMGVWFGGSGGKAMAISTRMEKNKSTVTILYDMPTCTCICTYIIFES